MSHGDPNYPGNVPIKPDELKILENKPATCDIINAARNIPIQRDFNIGDVLIAIDFTDKDKPNKPYLDGNGMPQKFQVIHKDEIGLLYCKKFNADGRLGKAIDLPATWDHKRWRFIQDPDVVDHVLLGNEEDYNPAAQAKRFKSLKDKISRHNRKLRILFNNENEVKEWAKTLAPGHVVWYDGYGGPERLEFKELSPDGKSMVFGFTKAGSGPQTRVVNFNHFSVRYYSYYTERPRIFKEECDNVKA